MNCPYVHVLLVPPELEELDELENPDILAYLPW